LNPHLSSSPVGRKMKYVILSKWKFCVPMGAPAHRRNSPALRQRDG
jgi:hypothetical protein